MKQYLFAVVLLSSTSVLADEFVTMSNGMTCWRNANGQLWGCSGGVNTGDSGFNDTRSGTRYEYINSQQAIDTRTGRPFGAPRYDPYDQDR